MKSDLRTEICLYLKALERKSDFTKRRTILMTRKMCATTTRNPLFLFLLFGLFLLRWAQRTPL